METIKNTTPNQLAYTTAIIFAVASFLITLIFNLLLETPFQIQVLLLFSITNAVLCYLLLYAALERFIYRKIKLIYKNIHRMKRSKSSGTLKSIDMNRNIIDEVEFEVREWAKENREEINELKKQEQYRREFLGNVSHELKTPIYNIQGYLETLIDGGLEDENINYDYLKKAGNNAERLGEIVEDLVAISRHETGSMEILWESFNIYNLAQEVMDSFEMMAKTNKVTLDFKPGCSMTTIVYADREKMRQVLTNLISNSLKYGKENGSTVLSIYNMDQNALVEVSDDGIGIEAQHLPRLFERFYRVDTSRSRQQGGSGLGLSLVKHILEAHNQTIHVRSKPRVGTTFGFTLALYE
ncbi:MAG: sensor histidine kinase [Chitinophagales bacterium]